MVPRYNNNYGCGRRSRTHDLYIWAENYTGKTNSFMLVSPHLAIPICLALTDKLPEGEQRIGMRRVGEEDYAPVGARNGQCACAHSEQAMQSQHLWNCVFYISCCDVSCVL